MTYPPLTLIVPTFNRPEGVTRAVESLFAQTLVIQGGFTLIIVDNAPDASATDAVNALRKICPDTVTLINLHEPNAGVANARNTAMRAAPTDLVAFLDDDQSAPAEWLTQLLDHYAQYPAAVTFGPVETRLPDPDALHREYFERFFARLPDLETGYTDQSFGCGNALVDFARIDGTAPWFDVAMNEIGGEDDRLFERVRASGGTFAWAAHASVFEHPPEKRIHLRYTLKRAFAYGQGPVTMARMAQPTRYLEIAKWMAVGSVKAAIHGALWLFQLAIRHPKRAYQLDEAIRGAAKVLWFVDFKFYGQAMLEKKPHRMRLFNSRQPSNDEATDAR
jgi:glycosyltransferase involved in cell wall biosynthesis